MNKTAQSISNRLSLRKPQEESLEILSGLLTSINIGKSSDISRILKDINALYPTCTDFERSFPSICFSLATGVGKTRLMGAFISYLYIAKGIRNFFVLAPNLTIYKKLIDDFSKPENPKYVFNGIAEFVTNPPRIVDGDNYDSNSPVDEVEGITINVFNISKINAEVRVGREPRIKRLSEYIGESYFNYLAALPDLVVLMDESHHYRSDSGMKAINELNPILGLELTATPKDSQGKIFKNVVYDYPLAKAIKDGFVKIPAVATRRNFDPSQYTSNPDELDLIKLQDGMRIHEDTKIHLVEFSKNNNAKLVKPFVLIVAKDTTHAEQLKQIIEAGTFYDGKYSGKVMQIHSNQRGEEKDENIQLLLDLEKADNTMEIVIHVNMLKEGWDVTNLYTIIPLRASTSVILTEQTIGRGLRLPYGRRTGEKAIDTLTIVAHDKYNAIVEEANKPGSLINRENVIELDDSGKFDTQEIITSQPIYLKTSSNDNNNISTDSHSVVMDVISSLNQTTKKIEDLTASEIQEVAFEKIAKHIEGLEQQILNKEEVIRKAKESYTQIVQGFVRTAIPIPKIIIKPITAPKVGFKSFSLDFSDFNVTPVSEEIVRRDLSSNRSDVIKSTQTITDTNNHLEIILIDELLVHSQIDYERDKDLLFKLVKECINRIIETFGESAVTNIVFYRKKEIASFVFEQLKQHFYVEKSEYDLPEVLPFTLIEQHNLSKYTKDDIHNYKETIDNEFQIRSYIFAGFEKSCHEYYKFDSKPEKDFSMILEDDSKVIRWLRPAPAQFHIYWDNNSRRYEPDFVVETNDVIYMVEIKKESDIETVEVQLKAESAKKYCEIVSNYNLRNGGKKWVYVLIPHNRVKFNMSFDFYIK